MESALLTLIAIGATCLLMFAMAAMSRMCGDDRAGPDQWLYALPFGVAAIIGTGYLSAFFIPFLFAVVGKRTGHGRGMDLAKLTMEFGSAPEKVEYLILPLIGVLPMRVYKLAILRLTQLLLVLGLAVVGAIAGNPAFALGACLLSFTKPLAYELAFRWHGTEKPGLPATEIAEHAVGAFDALGLVLLVWVAA